MAGLVTLTQDTTWEANNTQFNWVLDFLVRSVADSELRKELQHIDALNLKHIDLTQLRPEWQQELRNALHTQLISDAERHLPATLEGRAMLLQSLQLLADSAGL
jgi:hypothetical protein